MLHGTRGISLLLLQSALLCVFAVSVTAALSVYQGRVVFSADTGIPGIDTYEVEGVAPVQLGGNAPPSYFFECNTTSNNGAGIHWSRQSGTLSSVFTTERTTNGLKLNVPIFMYSDLDVYFCTDTATDPDEQVSLNITSGNPAVCPVESTYTTSQGLAVQLEVYAAAFPPLRGDQIHWYRPDMTEIMESDPNVRFANIRKTLILSNVQLTDAGSYAVEAAIPVGNLFLRGRTGIDLEVHVPPVITTEPENSTVVLERQSFSLSCSASGNPPPSITWRREDASPLPVINNVDTQSSMGAYVTTVTSTLTVPEAVYADIGNYQCSAINGVSNDAVLSQFSQVTVRPDLILSAKDSSNSVITFTDVLSQPEGSQFTVECLGSGDLVWTSSTGFEIPSNVTGDLYQQHDVTSGKLTLHFTSFNQSNVAVYTCVTQLVDINNVPIARSLLVTSSNPAVFIQPTIQYVLEGGTVAIEAGVYSSPSDPTVEWYLGGQLLDIGSNPRLLLIEDAPLYTLMVSDVNSGLLGEYSIVVTLGGQSAMDSVNVSYPTPPSVSVSLSNVTLDEGSEVRVQCLAEGTGMVSIDWLLGNGQSLPSGVIQNGTELYIAMATSAHAGTYECRVTNLAGTVIDTTEIIVRYAPFSVVGYNQLFSTSNQILSAEFVHSNIAPEFICTSDGYPTPQLTWRKQGGELPNGVTIQTGGGQGQLLTWQRPLEYTDSGNYECVSENGVGDPNVATLKLLVQFYPIINTIFRSAPVEGTSSDAFLVPTGHAGLALTCLAFGWPVPYVEWLWNGNTLPSGVRYETTEVSGTVSARLIWSRGFNSSDVGEYQCVVKEKESSPSHSEIQSVQIKETGTVTSPPPVTCSVSERVVHFQVRVLNTDCTTWGDSLKESIADAFQDEIISIVQSECSDCQVTQSTVQTLGLPACSTKVENGVVFRGTIETSSVSDSQSIYCALSDWQQTGPLVNINTELFGVDPSCPLQVDSFSSPECVSVDPGTLDQTTLIITIAAPTGAVLLCIVIVSLICCVCCRCRSNKAGEWRPRGSDPYSRNEPRYGPYGDVVGPSFEDPSRAAPLYSTLDRPSYVPNSAVRSPLPPPPPLNNLSPDHIPLEPSRSLSKDRLIDPESFDGGIRIIHMETDIDCPTPSTGNVENVGISVFGRYPNNSSSSGRNQSRNVISATNPMPDYEQLDYNYRGSPTNPHPQLSRMTSVGESTSGRKLSEGGSSPLSPQSIGGAGSYSILERDEKVSNGSNPRSPTGSVPSERVSSGSLRNFSRSSIEPSSASPSASGPLSSIVKLSDMIDEEHEPSQGSNCSEEPPPYSSRPPSELTPAHSMLDNSAYGGVHVVPTSTQSDSDGGRQWYLNDSDFSLDSKSRHSSNGRVEIPPYAMIHNSAIPYTPTELRQQTDVNANSNGAIPARASPKMPVFQLEQPLKRQSTPQPYSEPIRSSVASITSGGSYVRESPNFEMVTV